MIGACSGRGRSLSNPSARHAFDENLVVAAIAGEAALHAALRRELVERAVEGGQYVGRRGKPPLTVRREASPLILQVEAQRMCIAARALQGVAPNDSEPNAGNAFQTFVGAGDNRLERQPARIHRQRPKRAHRVDDQRACLRGTNLGHLLNRIENAGGGFTINDRNVGYERVALQHGLQCDRRGRTCPLTSRQPRPRAA